MELGSGVAHVWRLEKLGCDRFALQKCSAVYSWGPRSEFLFVENEDALCRVVGRRVD